MNLEVISFLLRSSLLVVLFLWIGGFKGYAQVAYATGTSVDDGTYDFHEQYDITQYEISPPKVYSLDQFVPKVGNQLHYPHDIGWSIAAATTIVNAVYSGVFNKENTIDEFRSPYFVNMLWSSEINTCEQPQSLSRSIDKLRNTGIPKLKEYIDFCPTSVNQAVVDSAGKLDKYRYEKAFERTASAKEKVYRIKTNVSLDRPVIISFHCPPSFVNALDFWSPKEAMSEEFPLHSVVVIGYDDEAYGGAFQVLNSWSRRWGNEGKMWIRYEDADFIRYGYSVGYRSADQSRGDVSIVKGDLEFNNVGTKSLLSFTRFNPRGFYQFHAGAEELKFNLTGKLNKPFYLKMYYKSGGEVQQIYPIETWRSSLFEYSYNEIEVPGDGNFYTIEEDMFSSLYLFISLDNIDKIDFTELVKTTETIYDVLFVDGYQFSREISWDNQVTSFYSRLYEGEIIPLVIGLDFH